MHDCAALFLNIGCANQKSAGDTTGRGNVYRLKRQGDFDKFFLVVIFSFDCFRNWSDSDLDSDLAQALIATDFK